MLKQCMLCRTCVARVVLTNIKCQWRWKGSKTEPSESPLRRLVQDASDFGEGGAVEPELRWATEPYAARPSLSDCDDNGATDPQETTVLLFPGQGSQRVGMGRLLKDVPAARDLYELASSVVGWDVWRVCREGPADELDRRCQTAVMVTSLAALERVRETRPGALERARVAAGFSLGEITALVWAGALPLEAALRLVELRTAAMNAAAAERPGGMLTLWLAPDARLPALLAAAAEAVTSAAEPVCQVANYLYPGCKVVAGDDQALSFVAARGAEFGVRRSARVHVAGAWHTALMARAADTMRAALNEGVGVGVDVRAPRLRVVSAVDARPYGHARHVRRQLARHVQAPVRWEQTLHALYARPRLQRFPLTLALGPGGALRATLRQVNARAWDSCLQVDV